MPQSPWTSVLAWLVAGCALLDQPPPRGPQAAPDSTAERNGASEYAPLAALCECCVARAETAFQDALDALEAGSKPPRAGPGFAACAAALTGIPTVSPPPEPTLAAGAGEGTGFVELDAALEKQNLGWQFRIAGESTVVLTLKQGKRAHDRWAPIVPLIEELESRVKPAAGAVEDAHLAAQLCHATAMYVALEDAVQRERAHTEVVRRCASSARRADGIAGAATGLVLVLRRAAFARGAADLGRRVDQFRALRFDGEFESDADDVERAAMRHARTLADSLRDVPPPAAYSNDVVLPLWLAPRPTLSELCDAPPQSPADAARFGLKGLAEGDLRRLMLGARALYPLDSTSHHGELALCALLQGDDRRSLSGAREMVPRYSPAGALLASMADKS